MKVLVKDDYSIFRMGICALIKEHLNEIHPVESCSATDLFKQVVASGCDLVIINFRAEIAQAAAQLHLFRESFPHLPVIVMDVTQTAMQAFNNNANIVFLDSNCSLAQLTASIEKALGTSISQRQQ